MTAGEEERILILAPVGRDGSLARETLARAGLVAEVCADVQGLCDAAGDGVGAVLLTQEALSPEAMDCLSRLIASQPPWSDLPIVVLVSGGQSTPAVAHLTLAFGHAVNVSFRERPLRAETLVNAVQVALRARRRQYQLREYLASLAAAQDAERQARLAMEEAVRTRDDFLASVAHDLKNPLGGIKGYAQLLRRQMLKMDFAGAARLVDGLTKIDAMVARIVSQVDELLDLARLQAGQPIPLSLELVDLVDLAQKVAAEFRPTTSHTISVEDRDEEVAGVWDRARLERVLGNLLSNAIKYSKDRSEITVSVSVDDSGADSFALLAVRDRGIGVPAADQPRIFERFYRARNSVGRIGSGLGLAGVLQIVEQHGGTVTIQSEEGRGSVFTVRLPLVQVGDRRTA